MKETEALWILFQGDFSDRARCNFISRRRRKCRAAGKTRNRKKFDRSIDRSVGRSIGRSRETRTLPIVVSFVATNMPRRICIHAEIRGLSARSRKYLTSIEATVWNSSCFGFSQIYFYRTSREDTYVSTNLFERNGEGTGRGGEYFPDSRLPTSRAILRNCLFLGRKQSRYLGCYNIDLLARRTPT